jgi:hypothetical protein
MAIMAMIPTATSSTRITGRSPEDPAVDPAGAVVVVLVTGTWTVEETVVPGVTWDVVGTVVDTVVAGVVTMATM